MPMTMDERAAALENALHSARMEGGEVSAEGLRILQAWVRGELSDAEAEAAMDRAHGVDPGSAAPTTSSSTFAAGPSGLRLLPR